jgi:hypothetical protein
MITILLLFTLFLGLAITSSLWGNDSADKIDSLEWDLRKNWFLGQGHTAK